MQEQKRIIRRGDVFYADLSPVVGCEQGGIRTVLVIQNDIGNQYSRPLIVEAITSKHKMELPTHEQIGCMKPLQKNSVVLLEQIRTIDRIRLLEYIGSLSELRMISIDQALSLSLGLTTAKVIRTK